MLRVTAHNSTQVVNIFITAALIVGLQHGLGKHQVETSFPVWKALLTFGKARVDAEDPHPPSYSIIILKVCNVSTFETRL